MKKNKLLELVKKGRSELFSDVLQSFENVISSDSLVIPEALLYRYFGVAITNIEFGTRGEDSKYITRFIIDDDLNYFSDNIKEDNGVDELTDYKHRLDMPLLFEYNGIYSSRNEEHVPKIKHVIPILKILEKNGYIIKYDDEHKNLVVFVDTESEKN